MCLRAIGLNVLELCRGIHTYTLHTMQGEKDYSPYLDVWPEVQVFLLLQLSRW